MERIHSTLKAKCKTIQIQPYNCEAPESQKRTCATARWPWRSQKPNSSLAAPPLKQNEPQNSKPLKQLIFLLLADRLSFVELRRTWVNVPSKSPLGDYLLHACGFLGLSCFFAEGGLRLGHQQEPHQLQSELCHLNISMVLATSNKGHHYQEQGRY